MSDRDFHLLLCLTGAVLVSMALLYVYGGFLSVIVAATLVDTFLRRIETMRAPQTSVRAGQGE